MNTDYFVQWTTAFLVVALAFLALHLLSRGMKVVDRKEWLPPTVKVLAHGFLRWSIYIAVLLYVLELLGFPAKSLWAGLLSVLLLVAIAFFAMWSVLSNILSAVLLLTFSRARIGDIVELKDIKQDEVGIRGKIVDINLFFVTLEEQFIDEKISDKPAMVQIPCHLFFYRATRCWAGAKTQPLMVAFQGDEEKPRESAE